MSNTPNTTRPATEIDTASLDQVVGAGTTDESGVVVHQLRKQEQGDKLTSEEVRK